MGRPPVFSPEVKTRIVLSVIAGEVNVTDAAPKERGSEQPIGRWKAEFLEAGKTAWQRGSPDPRHVKPSWSLRSRTSPSR